MSAETTRRARGHRRRVAETVIGVDGSSGSRRAVSFVSRLAPPRNGRVMVVRVVEPVRVPALFLLPASARAVLSAQAALVRAAALRAARRNVDLAVTQLQEAGWQARGQVRSGIPLTELLKAARQARADLVVVGARGISPAEKLLLGSVADAITKRSPVSVLVVR